MNWIRRAKHRWWLWRTYVPSINRRAKIEQMLWDVYHGKRKPPSGEESKAWAQYMGVPAENRSQSQVELFKRHGLIQDTGKKVTLNLNTDSESI